MSEIESGKIWNTVHWKELEKALSGELSMPVYSDIAYSDADIKKRDKKRLEEKLAVAIETLKIYADESLWESGSLSSYEAEQALKEIEELDNV